MCTPAPLDTCRDFSFCAPPHAGAPYRPSSRRLHASGLAADYCSNAQTSPCCHTRKIRLLVALVPCVQYASGPVKKHSDQCDDNHERSHDLPSENLHYLAVIRRSQVFVNGVSGDDDIGTRAGGGGLRHRLSLVAKLRRLALTAWTDVNTVPAKVRRLHRREPTLATAIGLSQTEPIGRYAGLAAWDR